jgi:hypothetical protein
MAEKSRKIGNVPTKPKPGDTALVNDVLMPPADAAADPSYEKHRIRHTDND